MKTRCLNEDGWWCFQSNKPQDGAGHHLLGFSQQFNYGTHGEIKKLASSWMILLLEMSPFLRNRNLVEIGALNFRGRQPGS